MGFLDRFRREKEEVEKPVKLGINEIDDWFTREFSPKIRESERRAEELKEIVMKNFMDIKRSATILEIAKFEGKEKVHSAANMVKELFVNRAYNSIRTLEGISFGNDYSGMLEFHGKLSKILRELTNLTPKQTVLLSTYFKDESESVIKDIKRTKEQLDELKKFLDSEGRFLFLGHDIKSKRKEILDSQQKLEKVDKQEKNLKARLNELENKRSSFILELEKFVKSNDYMEMESLDEEIERMKKERLGLEQAIRNEISQIERPLKKLDYLVSKNYALSGGQEKFLGKFIEKPFETLLESGSEATLTEILNVINSLVKEEKISLKAKEEEKVRNMIRKLGKDIPKRKEVYRKISTDIRDSERERERYKEILSRRRKLEENIKSRSEEAKDIRDGIKKTSKEKESLREGIKNKRKLVEESIFKNADKKVIIAE